MSSPPQNDENNNKKKDGSYFYQGMPKDKPPQKKKKKLPPPIPDPSEFPSYEPKSFFRFEILHESTKSQARVGRIHTPHGIIDTPGFKDTQGPKKDEAITQI